MPAIQPYIIEPIWEQFSALLPERKSHHPLGCHGRRIPDSVVFEKGKPAPLGRTKRWVIERTCSWHNAHKKLVWCTERRGEVIDFWVAFSEVVIIVGRLLRKAWTRYRWDTRPSRRP